MTDTESDDVMQQTWCCFTCSSTFRWGGGPDGGGRPALPPM